MHHWISLTAFPCVTAPWLRIWSLVHGSSHALVGSTLLGWACSIGTSPTYQPDGVWWLWLLGPMRIINFVAYNSSMTLSPNNVATLYRPLCQRIQNNYHAETVSQRLNPEANLYETFDLTSASCDTSQRPFTQVCPKGCIRNLEWFW